MVQITKVDICVWSYSDNYYNFCSYIGHSRNNEIVFSCNTLFSIYGDNEFACYGGILNAMEEAKNNKISKINVLISNPIVLQNVVEEPVIDNRFLKEIVNLKKRFSEFNINYVAIKDNMARFEITQSAIEKTRKLSFYDRAIYLSINSWSPSKNVDGLTVQNNNTGVVYGIPENERDKDNEYVLVGMSNKRAQKIVPNFDSLCKYYNYNDALIRNTVWQEYLGLSKMIEIY